MHIGFLSLEYPPLPSGGIGTSVRTLARSLVAQGHRVTVVGWGARAEFEDEGVRVRFLGDSPVPKMGWLLNRRTARVELARLCEEEGLEVVEAHDWCGPSAGIDLPCPVAIHCNGSATYFAHLLREPVRPSVRWAEALALRRADALSSVSRFTGEMTRELFGLDRPVEVIPNSVDVRRFQPARPEELEPATLLYFGTLVRKKGVLDLGPMLSRVRGARLYIAGRDNPDRQTGASSTWELLAASFSPEARARAEYLGPLPYDAVQERVRRAAVCVFPSYAEALPLAWLEAMACGKPIVAYDIGWAPEVVRSGVDGILVPPGDVEALAAAVRELLEDPDRASAFGAAARARVVADFSADGVARRAAAWYATLRKPS